MIDTKSSDAGIFLWMTYQAMQHMGLDAAAIFQSVHLPDQAPDKNIRRANSTQQRFWQAAEKISDDPYVGLHVGVNMPTFRGQVIEYLFLSSSTFGEGLERTLKYQKVLSSAFHLELQKNNEHAFLTGFQHPVRHYQDCAISILVNFFRYMSDGKFRVNHIQLPYSKDIDAKEYEHQWQCAVEFGHLQGRLCFDSDILNLPSPAAEPDLLKIHENIAEQQLEILEKHQLIDEIEKILASGVLESGQFDQEYIAELLQKNPRTLRADLQLINSSYEKILANYREKLSRKLLAYTQENIDQIVYLTGFSEPSAFSRAFKKWTGETPTAYRQRKMNST
ncbi:AraC family transcriptional regulator [Acinetobacter wuhouensis]|uniref:AraC family transcriptional regulator n=1 Tax=Acinetobacter wuhouensis TaxID=1879050 RepID=A0A4Q7AKD2_9GAMM|nr:AraC family transcriptional regulator [Acinetobacter wuhouensis]RZG47310.1 AraC family transcriptional regulator [Acinetobacter wuhouensis]